MTGKKTFHIQYRCKPFSKLFSSGGCLDLQTWSIRVWRTGWISLWTQYEWPVLSITLTSDLFFLGFWTRNSFRTRNRGDKSCPFHKLCPWKGRLASWFSGWCSGTGVVEEGWCLCGTSFRVVSLFCAILFSFLKKLFTFAFLSLL